MTESIKNAQIRNLDSDFSLQDQDLVVEDSFLQNSNEYGFNDRHQSQYDIIRRGSDHTS